MTTTATAPGALTRPRDAVGSAAAARLPAEVMYSSGPFHATRWQLIVAGEATFKEWERAGRFFKAINESSTWVMADWLVWGEAHFGEDSAQVLDDFRYSEGGLANLRTLYAAFPPERRRWRLGKSYYQAVLPLVKEAQEMVLDAAVRQRLTRDEVRNEVRALPDEARRRPRPERFQVATLPAPVPAAPNDNGHAVEVVDAGLRLLGEGDVVLADVFRTHDRGRGLEDAEPEYAPVRPAGMAAEVIYSFERQVTLCFDVTPDLRVRQRVRVFVEVVK